MRWLLLFAVVGLVGAGCEKTVYRSHEGQYCSSSEDDELYYECARSSDLICLNTYEKYFTQANQPDRVVPIWLCTEACDPTLKNPCARTDEVCCPGNLFGRDYTAKRATNPMPHGCVLREFCDALLGAGKDGGAKPDANKPDAGADLGSTPDAPANDAGEDAASDI